MAAHMLHWFPSSGSSLADVLGMWFWWKYNGGFSVGFGALRYGNLSRTDGVDYGTADRASLWMDSLESPDPSPQSRICPKYMIVSAISSHTEIVSLIESSTYCFQISMVLRHRLD